ncbi:MAG: CRISPR-associated helicase Cas3' [Treponemataceae bacterium]|nr:CRISPR-associated helicase Cas3' [Treponemataceae bacterium]
METESVRACLPPHSNIAHIASGRTQPLNEHLKNVAELAKQFASDFNNADWAEIAGLWHDLGKAMPEWQMYIAGKTSRSINHSEAGAALAFKHLDKKMRPFEKVIPYLIAGHHAGLPDWHEGSGTSLKSILLDEKNDGKRNRQTACIANEPSLTEIAAERMPASIPFGKNNPSESSRQELLEQYHLWIRMLYSCLVDADFLDTEEFMEPEASSLRGSHSSLEELKCKFESYMKEKQSSCSNSKINAIRKAIYDACVEKSSLKPGFYSLNVPTGGGKTLASMAFALHHAATHGKRRIILAIPYTSIIEQTATVYKYGTDDNAEIKRRKKAGTFLFGEEAVLEHHSNFDFDGNDESDSYRKQKLAAENWDAPIIVTTNVQLFESLFNAHSSRCRKLHNIVDSVIILDEVQMLPPEYLKSILSALKGLVSCFGASVVLCTATQPALEGTIGSNAAAFSGIPENAVVPIIEHPEELAEQLKRVQIDATCAHEKIAGWNAIADKLVKYNQVLCIVQTRKDCRELHGLMPEGTYHLSALMCAEERSEAISEIKQKVKNNKTVRVISTQLIECGVDIDFPVVFRAMAGVDSIAQSAGRCNREGRLAEFGTVHLFEPPTETPAGLLRKGADATRDLLRKYNYNLELTPSLYKEYFKHFYASVNDFDKPKFADCMLDENEDGIFQFRTLSDNYRLINDSFQKPVIIRYFSPKTKKSNDGLLAQLMNQGPDKRLMRKLGRYSVNLPKTEIAELARLGRIIEPFDGIFVQAPDDENLYQYGKGLAADSVKSYSTYIF